MKIFTAISSNFKAQLLLALLFSILVISIQSLRETPNPLEGDSGAYMPLAQDLVDKGVFTDGRHYELSVVRGKNGEGMFFAPLYPALMAGVMTFDKALYDTVACHNKGADTGHYEDCTTTFGLLFPVHIVLAIVAAFLIWVCGWVLTGRYSVAWGALVLGCAAQAYAYYTAQIMTENLLFPLYTAASLFAVMGWKKRDAKYWLLCGIFLGLAALTRPPFAYLLYAGVPTLIVLVFLNKTLSTRQKLLWPMLLVLGYAGAAGPWMVRNGLAMNEYKISTGYAPFILTQRISFNDMTWKEWGASFVYGLPGFGDSLSKRLFKPETYERFDYDNPKGFYGVRIAVRDRTEKEAGSKENHLSYVIKHEILGNLYKHTMVTLSLAWRGMWVRKTFGLIAIPLFAVVFVIAWRKKWTEFFIFAIPPWFMLGFHAFTSVNVVRYNLILIPCLAVAAAFLIDKFIRERKKAS